MSIIGVLIFCTGFIYVWLAARNNWSCWYWGILSCGMLSYVSFTSYLLYADGFLQIIYVIMGFIGLYQWKYGTVDEVVRIRTLPIKYHVMWMIVGSSLAMISGLVLQQFSGAFATYIDSFTTVFSLIATGLLIQRYIDNWIYWIIINPIMAILYVYRGGQLQDNSAFVYAGLMMIYAGFAVYGWYNWKRIQQQQI